MSNGWMKHPKTSFVLNNSLLRLFAEQGCMGPTGAKWGALAPQNLGANTHIESLGALRSFWPLVTWVALKCKTKRAWLGHSGAVRAGQE